MTELLRCIRGFLALFIIMLLFLQLVPEQGMKKYVLFFSRLILSLGFVYPLLSVFYGGDSFLDNIQYETFAEELREISADTVKLEYMQKDYYLEKYEGAVEEDVYRMAADYVEPYGFSIGEVEVELNEEYAVKALRVSLRDGERDETGRESAADAGGKEAGSESVCRKLKTELGTCYRAEEAEVRYICDGALPATKSSMRK